MAEFAPMKAEEIYAGLKDARIMMVDDEPLLMDVLEIFLEEKGYRNFLKVEDSRLAMSTLEEYRPDILLLDLKMPHVDGLQILEMMRVNPLLERIPVIVLTSSSDAPTKLTALELGAMDFLAKPVDSSELSLRLRNTLTVKAYQDQLTFYDALTRLPNRKLFIDRLEWLLKAAKRKGRRLAVINVGLDRFGQINGSLGPAVGDEVLKEVSSRLMSCLRESDVVSRAGIKEADFQLARLGGDEFSILLPGLNPAESAGLIAARIQKALQPKFEIGSTELYVTASLGIAVYPEDGEEALRLIKNAGAATSYAKEAGQGQSQFYSKEINALSKRKLSIEAELRRAIDNDEFVLHYQPKIDVQSGLVRSAEALIRWNNPERGLMYPDGFISIAEDIGLIIPIGEWVLREACRQQVRWLNQGIGDLTIAVNVSGPQFNTSNLKYVIQNALEQVSMQPQRLKLEITESMLMGEAEASIHKLHDIRSIGTSFSIDDFGTGYSSLSYLRRFPLDELKIDRSFIMDVPTAKDDGAIVRAIIALAHSLELNVVAEGVENAAQVAFLRALNCDVIQGYYFSKPLPATDFEQYIRALKQSTTDAYQPRIGTA
ncbi:MAG: diguanylate cyclase (GGDEF)-like protein [Halioglobus sp.]